MKYYAQASLDPGAGTVAAYVFRANSLYDPDYTSGTESPRGFDEFMSVFDHYAVLTAKITATFQSTSDVQCGIVTSDSAALGTTVIEYRESRFGITKVLANERPVTITKYVSIPKILNINNPAGNSLLRGTSSTDPPAVLFFHVWGASQDESTDPGSIYLNVTIEFLSVFTEPKKPALSAA